LNMMTSVREERLRAWSLLLLAATVRSFAHMPLGVSDRTSSFQKIWVVQGSSYDHRSRPSFTRHPRHSS